MVDRKTKRLWKEEGWKGQITRYSRWGNYLITTKHNNMDRVVRKIISLVDIYHIIAEIHTSSELYYMNSTYMLQPFMQMVHLLGYVAFKWVNRFWFWAFFITLLAMYPINSSLTKMSTIYQVIYKKHIASIKINWKIDYNATKGTNAQIETNVCDCEDPHL